MFVLFGKTFGLLIYPLGIAAVTWLAALLCHWRRRRGLARRLTLVGVFVVLYFSQPWVGDGLARSLEDDYPLLPAARMPAADVIVVLGGSTSAPIAPRVAVEVNGAFDRLLYGARLWQAGKAPYLLLSGGVIASLTGSKMTEALQLRQLAMEYGVAASAIVLEEQSRSTRENAFFTAPILRQRGWRRVLLVTSAQHMRRAVGVFEHLGVEIIAAPTDITAVQRPLSISRFLPDVEALRVSHRATKEYVGIFVYWLRGWL